VSFLTKFDPLASYADWPEVPDDARPKELPHIGDIPDGQIVELEAKGWEPVDVRLKPRGADAVKGWLEGIRLGTIDARDQKVLKFLELEAKVYGLLSNRVKSGDKKRPGGEIRTLEELMSIGETSFSLSPAQKRDLVVKSTPAKRGRPKKEE
jgi:hypothetical protein